MKTTHAPAFGTASDRSPWVTIVTPAYNQAAFLAATIDSVLAQTYRNVEYIVIDDGSTDSTPAVMAAYASRVHCLRQPNRGQAATLNRGWKLARGTYIGYLSSDDILVPDALEVLVHALTARADAAGVYCDFDLIDGAGRLIRPVRTEDFERRRLVEDLVCQPGPGALFRRDAFLHAGGWREDLHQIPDFEFWTRVARYGDLVRVPRRLAGCRVHEESASFRKISRERCDEIVHLVASDTYPVSAAGRTRALATALLMSAKRHVSAGRPLTGAARLLRAFAMRPRLAARAATWRMMASALLRRTLLGARARAPAQGTSP